MDYLIDKYERALKITKIWTPATLAILAPLMIATPFAIKYLIRRRFLKREIEKAEDFFNAPTIIRHIKMPL